LPNHARVSNVSYLVQAAPERAADASAGNGETICIQAQYALARHAQARLAQSNPAQSVPLYVDGIPGVPPAPAAEHGDGEAHLRMLMRELTHRSKNLLAVVQAMARQSARQGGSVAYFLDHFSARLQALSRSHDLLVQESWCGVSLRDLMRSQLAQYLACERVQVFLEGPDIRLKPEVAQSLGLALHELAANAAKYGALSRLRGRVAIAWRMTGDGLDLLWSESCGPKVKEPRRRGFGSVAIEHNLARVLGCKVELNFAAGGVQCRVFVPCGQFAPVRQMHEPAHEAVQKPALEPGVVLQR
jgi:two-component sensor histidine kinase